MLMLSVLMLSLAALSLELDCNGGKSCCPLAFCTPSLLLYKLWVLSIPFPAAQPISCTHPARVSVIDSLWSLCHWEAIHSTTSSRCDVSRVGPCMCRCCHDLQGGRRGDAGHTDRQLRQNVSSAHVCCCAELM